MPINVESLHVTALMDPSMGGPPQGIRASVEQIKNHRVSGEVLSCDAPGAAWLGKDPFPVHALGPCVPKLLYTPKLSAWLDHNLGRFDSVVVHGIWVWPSVCTARAVLRERKRRKTKGGSEKPLRFFVMCHGMLDPWFQRDKSRRVKAVRNLFYWWLLERKVLNSADAVLFTCQQELELARTTFGGYRPKKEINIGYGIAEPPVFDTEMRDAFTKFGPGLEGRPYLLFLSRIHPKKNVPALVRAYSRVRREVMSGQSVGAEVFPDLVVAGPGWDSGYGREVRALIDEANRSIASAENRMLQNADSGCIHAVDMLQGDAKWGALYGCEAFVLPSHQENFGIAVVEALACAKPVLISDQVNIWREIAEAGAGLVESDTEKGVEKLLRHFIALKDKQRMADRARECYLARFSIGPAASNFAQVLKHGTIIGRD